MQRTNLSHLCDTSFTFLHYAQAHCLLIAPNLQSEHMDLLYVDSTLPTYLHGTSAAPVSYHRNASRSMIYQVPIEGSNKNVICDFSKVLSRSLEIT